MKLGAFVEGILIEKDATLNEASFFAEFALEFEFAENHDCIVYEY